MNDLIKAPEHVGAEPQEREEQLTFSDVNNVKNEKEGNYLEGITHNFVLTPDYLRILKKSLDQYMSYCLRELRDPEVRSDSSIYEDIHKIFSLTVDLLYKLDNASNVIIDEINFIEVDSELPF